jgi:class 3 adenylate cyclase/pimeloyl-ACP methyl ester carboxylesterase
MEPRIQYARTSDGVNIAYCMAGQGRTLIQVPSIPWSHVQREWDTFSYFLPVKALAQQSQIIWYDSRGCGLSDRQAVDFSLDSMIRDLSAVIDKLGIESIDMCAMWDGVPVAISYAANNPERVSSLVLVEAYSSGSDYLDTPAGQVELGIRDKDWVIYTEMLARILWGFDDPISGAAEYMRACATPDALRAAYDVVNYSWDVSDLLPLVTARTLVLHSETNPWLSVTSGQKVAAAITGSEFRLLEDMRYASLPGTIAEFLGIPLKERVAPATPSGTAVILFADIVDSTRLTEQLGDSGFRERARDLDEAMRAAINKANGTPIEGKLLGDGVLAVFAAARDAIAAALTCRDAARNLGLELHLGLHAGDVIREANNVYGGAVNIAARIAAASAPGEVLVSDTVRSLARTSAGVSFEDRGERPLKGVSDAVRVYEVSWRQ